MTITRRSWAALLALLLTVTSFYFAGPALAQPAPHPGDNDTGNPPSPIAAVSDGSPWWMFALVAAGSALLTIAVLWLIAPKLRGSRRLSPAPA
jgi:hypothetical protein